jgi:hypothetical protein
MAGYSTNQVEGPTGPLGRHSTRWECRIMKAFSWVVVIAVVAWSASPCLAQYRRGGGGGGGVGTAESAYLNGMGNLVRNEGLYNLETAQANIAQEQANQLYLQNRLQATKTYFEMRQLNRQYTQQEHGKPMTRDAMSHYSSQLRPRTLTASQLDPVTGQIVWPLTLMDERYSPYRAQFDTMFALRAQHQPLNPNEVRQAADGMQALLRQHIDDFAPQDFENAHHFIESLAYEAHFPAS